MTWIINSIKIKRVILVKSIIFLLSLNLLKWFLKIKIKNKNKKREREVFDTYKISFIEWTVEKRIIGCQDTNSHELLRQKKKKNTQPCMNRLHIKMLKTIISTKQNQL